MATIANVADNEIIETSWGNSVANELNNNTVKRAGSSMTGPLVITANPALRLRRTDNQPIIYWEHETGTPRYGYLQGSATGMLYQADVGTHIFRIAGVEVAELTASGTLVLPSTLQAANGALLGRSDGSQQLSIVDTNGGGVAGNAFIAFYPSGSSMTSAGTRGAYVGYNGEGFQVQVDLGKLTLQTVGPDDIVLEAGGDIAFRSGAAERARMSGTIFLIGKATSNTDNAGVEISTTGAANLGSIASTTTASGHQNLYLRHMGSADATGQVFARFTRAAAGTLSGTVTQTASGVAYNETSDYRLKDELGPVVDPLARLQSLAPKHLAWKMDGSEFDGFIAHEVQAVAPYAVQGVKDAVLPAEDPDNPGGIDPQQFDASKLVPLLTAAVQELAATVAALQARIDTLEVG